MLDYTDIIDDVNKVISHSQGFNANAESLLKKWAVAKEEISNNFLDGKLIKSLGFVSMKLSDDDKAKAFNDFIEVLSRNYNYPLADLISFVNLNYDSFFDNLVSVGYTTADGTKIKSGMKLSKAFKFFVDDEDILDDIQTLASRIIQNNVLSGELCVSIHPLDFLSSSENSYNWRSCHSLNGEYRSGNLSYMVDSTTFIAYIKGKDKHILPHFPDDIKWNSKKWRTLFFTSENFEVLFAGRQYPFNLGTAALDLVLEGIKPGSTQIKIFFMGRCRDWSHWHKDQINSIDFEEFKEDNSYLSTTYIPIHGNLYKLKDVVYDNEGSRHFNDLLCSSVYKPYYCWSSNTRHKPKIAVGGLIPCPCCNKPNHYVDYTELMLCEDCSIACGLADDENHAICPDCGRVYHVNDMYWSEIYGEYICNSCLDEYYDQCECCGEMFKLEDLVKDDNGCVYCESCYSDIA